MDNQATSPLIHTGADRYHTNQSVQDVKHDRSTVTATITVPDDDPSFATESKSSDKANHDDNNDNNGEKEYKRLSAVDFTPDAVPSDVAAGTVRVVHDLRWSELCAVAYRMCTQTRGGRFPAELYSSVRITLARYCSDIILQRLACFATQDRMRLLVHCWKMYKIYVHCMVSCFSYVENTFVTYNRLESIRALASMSFQQQVLAHTNSAILHFFNESLTPFRSHDRTGTRRPGPGMDDTVRALVRMYGEVDETGRYYAQFEDGLLTQFRSYYVSLSHQCRDMHVLQALDKILSWRECERRIANTLLTGTSAVKVLHLFDECLIRTQRKHLVLERADEWTLFFADCFRDIHARSSHLAALELLLNDMTCAAPLSTYFEAAIQSICSELSNIRDIRAQQSQYRLRHSQFAGVPSSVAVNAAPGRPSTADGDSSSSSSAQQASRHMIKYSHSTFRLASFNVEFLDQLVSVFRFFSDMISSQLQNNAQFTTALHTVFTSIVNAHVGDITNTELLACFCDHILNRKFFCRGQDDIDAYIAVVSQLVSFAADEELFRHIYQGNLASRLLELHTQSQHSELSALAKFRQHLGRKFTSCLDTMLDDMERSRQLMTEFESHSHFPAPPCVDVVDDGSLVAEVRILTTGVWPALMPLKRIRVPELFQQCMCLSGGGWARDAACLCFVNALFAGLSVPLTFFFFF
jgi:Cullin family